MLWHQILMCHNPPRSHPTTDRKPRAPSHPRPPAPEGKARVHASTRPRCDCHAGHPVGEHEALPRHAIQKKMPPPPCSTEHLKIMVPLWCPRGGSVIDQGIVIFLFLGTLRVAGSISFLPPSSLASMPQLHDGVMLFEKGNI